MESGTESLPSSLYLKRVTCAQVQGTWKFHMSATGRSKHEKCSKASTNYGGGDFGLGEPNYDTHKSVSVHLGAPNVATMTDASGKKTVGVQYSVSDCRSQHASPPGTWTMIYDEGFEVRIENDKVHHYCSMFCSLISNGSFLRSASMRKLLWEPRVFATR